MTGWYVLVSDWAERDRMPRALGPYPSQEFCRLAAQSMVPDDRQFWTDEERATREAYERAAEARLQAELAVGIAELGGKAGQVTIGGTTYSIDAEGRQRGSMGPGCIYSGPTYRALTGCVFIDTEHK